MLFRSNELTAPQINYNQTTSEMEAVLLKDSSGKVISYPTFNQGDFKTISDTIRFNMKTGRGITKGTYTQQGEMYVYGEKIKKVNDDVFYAKNGRFTTCNLDTPHFAFISQKIKFINKKMAFTGPVHPEIEGVPLPVMLPFGIRLDRFMLERYPGSFQAASFSSRVTVSDSMAQKSSGPNAHLISMNEPLEWRGFTFYQSS